MDNHNSPASIRDAYARLIVSEPPSSLFKALADSLANSGVSPAMVWVQLCAIVSLLTQGLADVLWPNGHRAPVGANGLIVGLSGSGKSAVYRLLMGPIEEFLLRRNPKTLLDLLIEDATIPSIIAHLKVTPYSAIFSDEAGALTYLQGAGPVLAKLLDAAPLRRSRAKTELIQLVGYRLNMLQMMQPRVFYASRLFSTAAGGEGLINRFMVASATPLMGSLHDLVLPERVAREHTSRCHALLEATSRNIGSKPARLPTIQLSGEATRIFKETMREARHYATTPGSPLQAHAEYVSRHPERVLRLAGAIHLFDHGPEGLEADISSRSLQLADEMGRRSVAAYQQLAHRPTQAETDAETIDRTMRMWNVQQVKVADLLRYSANIGLTRQRVKNALPAIVRGGIGHVVTYGKSDFLELFAIRLSRPPHLS